MLERISWTEYWMAVLILIVIYYSILIFLFKKILGKPWLMTPDSNKVQVSPEQRSLFNREDEPAHQPVQNQETSEQEILMPLVEDLVQEIKAYLAQISQSSFIKEEIVSSLKIIIMNYKKLQGSPYQKSINDFIIYQCEECCSIRLNAKEIGSIWLGD